MYLEKQALPSAIIKLGQVGKTLDSFLSWLLTLGTDVSGFLTTRERDSEAGTDVSGAKCLSVHQHCPQAASPPGLEGHCAPAICPLFSSKQVQEEKGEGQLLSSCSWLWLPAKVGKGEQ